jgi:uncharacterized protein
MELSADPSVTNRDVQMRCVARAQVYTDRLPVLAGVFRYPARRAVALNLAISLITVVSTLLIRGGTLSFAPLLGLLPIVVAMIIGAVSAAYVGTELVHRVSEHLLERVILVFLVVIGSALIVEAFLPQDVPGFLPDALSVRVVAAAVFGLGIGLVSSLLGVAGASSSSPRSCSRSEQGSRRRAQPAF